MEKTNTQLLETNINRNLISNIIQTISTLQFEKNLLNVLKKRLEETAEIIELAPLASIFLLGSILEGLLLATAEKMPKKFNQARGVVKTSKGKPKNFFEWPLAQLIDAAFEFNIIKQDAQKLTHFLREYRNYIHPYQEINENFSPNIETAAMCLKALDAASKQIAEHFSPDNIEKCPQKIDLTFLNRNPNEKDLILLAIIGSWNEKNENDIKIIEKFLNKKYEDIKKFLENYVCLPNSPIYFKNKSWEATWYIEEREQILKKFEDKLFDEDINKLKEITLLILNEKDTHIQQLQFPNSQPTQNIIFNRTLKHSKIIQTGITESLAILANKELNFKHCSPNKIKYTAAIIIREVLNNANWGKWAILNNTLPTLAEISPNIFLEQVEKALKENIFTEKTSHIEYFTGLLWALKRLAWHENYIVRVCVILAKLANCNTNNNWLNEAMNSLVYILLPWQPKTYASAEKRKVAFNTVVKEEQEIAWKLAMHLIKTKGTGTEPHAEPKWHLPKNIIENSKIKIKQFLEALCFYCEEMVKLVGNDIKKILELIQNYHILLPNSRKEFRDILKSEKILNLNEEEKTILWEKLYLTINKYKKHSETEWAIKDENELKELENVKNSFQPKSLHLKYKIFFESTGLNLFPECNTWEEEQNLLNEKRFQIIQELYAMGINKVIEFSNNVSHSSEVGRNLGLIANNSPNNNIDSEIMPLFSSLYNKKYNFIKSYLNIRYYNKGITWLNSLNTKKCVNEEKINFLSLFPLDIDILNEVKKLKKNEANYLPLAFVPDLIFEKFKNNIESFWQITNNLIKYGRCGLAISCMYHAFEIADKLNINLENKECISNFKRIINVKNIKDVHRFEEYPIVKLITMLQNDSSSSVEDIVLIEFNFINFLGENSSGKPKYLEMKLANEANYFCEIVKSAFNVTKENNKKEESIKKGACNLLYNWQIVPGMKENNNFDDNHFTNWFTEVKQHFIKNEALYHDALIIISKVLIYAPQDDNLWIKKSIAEVLNEEENELLRKQYYTALFDSRGVYYLDSSGDSEKKLANKYYEKASAVENIGYYRLATTLKKLAENYENESKIIISDYRS